MVNITEVIYFGYELELLEAHLAEHRPYVNRIIVAESQVTTTGHSKPLYARDNRSRYEKYDIELVEIPIDGYNKVTKSTEETGMFEWRFQGQDKLKKNYMHPRSLKNADWILHADTDEIIRPSSWPIIKEDLARNPNWNHAAMRLFETIGHINTFFKRTKPYRWCRAAEGFSVSNPKHPILQPRGMLGTKPLGWHFFACYSRPEEFYWKTLNRPWTWGSYGDNIPDLEKGIVIFEKYMQNWGELYKIQSDEPFLIYMKEMILDDPSVFMSKLIDIEALPKYIQENITRFPRIENGRGVRADV